MPSRARAGVFAAGAAICAGLAAAASETREEASERYGPLRQVVSVVRPLPARRELRPATAERSLELRRVPESFVPPDALTSPAQAVGRAPSTHVPAGSYLLASQLASSRAERRPDRVLPAGRTPVEITVQAASALAGDRGRRVDVVVSADPAPGRPARTYVAAAGVELLELRAAGAGSADLPSPGANDPWVATLALTRAEALRLIEAEAFARSIRLLRA